MVNVFATKVLKEPFVILELCSMDHAMLPLVSAHAILLMRSTQNLRDKCGQEMTVQQKHAQVVVPTMEYVAMMDPVLVSKHGLE